MFSDIEDVIEEIQKINKYAKKLGTPDEYFRHMNGHVTELSLVLSAFAVAENSETIIAVLEKQMPKEIDTTIGGRLYGGCPVCGRDQITYMITVIYADRG